jgi:hypothetical protein
MGACLCNEKGEFSPIFPCYHNAIPTAAAEAEAWGLL